VTNWAAPCNKDILCSYLSIQCLPSGRLVILTFVYPEKAVYPVSVSIL
jgi:hypothetical protein